MTMIITGVVFVSLGAMRQERGVAKGVEATGVDEGKGGATGEKGWFKEAEVTGVGEKKNGKNVPRRGAALIGARPAELERVKGKKLIALTFDDGPAGATTPRLLDILQEKKAKATFFVVGKMAQAAPDILAREERAGHATGSHTMGHVNLATLDVTGVRQDLGAIDGVFSIAVGHPTKLTRPPYGLINENVKTGVGQPLVTWTIDPEDWRTKDAEAIRRHVRERAFDGAIVLMHDIYPTTVDAVGGIIDDLRKEGYAFLTVPELAQARKVRLEAGVVYDSFRP